VARGSLTVLFSWHFRPLQILGGQHCNDWLQLKNLTPNRTPQQAFSHGLPMFANEELPPAVERDKPSSDGSKVLPKVREKLRLRFAPCVKSSLCLHALAGLVQCHGGQDPKQIGQAARKHIIEHVSHCESDHHQSDSEWNDALTPDSGSHRILNHLRESLP
jgi:hypothetical protein